MEKHGARSMSEILLILFVVLIFLLIILSVDVAFAVGTVGILWLIVADYPLTIAASRTLGSVDILVLLAIPFFILAAELMNSSEVTPKLVRIGNVTTGRIKGGLAQANVVTSMLFAGLSGSAVADVAALGSIFIPRMRDEGYDGAFSTALTAATSIVGPIIPPSIILIIYGAITNTSVGALFAAAIAPGIMLVIGMVGLVGLLAWKNDYPKYDEQFERKEYPRLIGVSLLVLTIPAIILIGIIGGFFTPTEAAVVACVWVTLIGVFVFRTLTANKVYTSLNKSILLTSQLYIIIALSGMLSWIIAREGIPQYITDTLLGTGFEATTIMILVAIVLLILGTWLDINAAVIILAPTLTQVAVEMGIHEIQFGLIIVMSLTIGLITPPIGLCLFAASSVSGISIGEITKKIIPFYITYMLVIGIIIYVPEATLYLPERSGLI